MTESGIRGDKDEAVSLPSFGQASSVQVSKEALDRLTGYTIWVRKHKNSDDKYAYILRNGYFISLHRFLMGLKSTDKRVVDHINHDTLENRYCNLRLCTRSQNQQNRRKRRGQILTSAYKGVRWHKKTSKWEAQICIQGKNKYLGLFAEEKDAALAYNEAASKCFGEFACLNELK